MPARKKAGSFLNKNFSTVKRDENNMPNIDTKTLRRIRRHLKMLKEITDKSPITRHLIKMSCDSQRALEQDIKDLGEMLEL